MNDVCIMRSQERMTDFVCKNIDCKHHMYWGLRGKHRREIIPNWESPYGLKYCFCMCLVDEPCTDADLAELYGVPERTVRYWYETALAKVRREVRTSGQILDGINFNMLEI